MKRLLTVANILWLAAYLIVMGAGAASLVRSRDWAADSYHSAEVQADWERWRAEAARQQEGQGPVMRRQPQSSEPPLVVLMRDHFGVCMAAWLVLGSAVFIMMMVLGRGVFSKPSRLPAIGDDHTERAPPAASP